MSLWGELIECHLEAPPGGCLRALVLRQVTFCQQVVPVDIAAETTSDELAQVSGGDSGPGALDGQVGAFEHVTDG